MGLLDIIINLDKIASNSIEEWIYGKFYILGMVMCHNPIINSENTTLGNEKHGFITYLSIIDKYLIYII